MSWVHAVTSFSTASSVLYLNGALVGSGPLTSAIVTGQRLNSYVGRGFAGDFFCGTIAYLRVWNGYTASNTDALNLYTFRQDCSPGKYGSLGSCYSCSTSTGNPYYAQTSSASCVICAAGTYAAVNALACINCVAGMYQASSGQSACISCAAGMYSTTTGASVSTVCSQWCPAGSYSAAGASVCTSCTAGTYQASSGQSSCVACLAGYYLPNSGATSGCSQCASGFFATSYASNCVLNPSHAFDFRGCTSGVAVVVQFSAYTATPSNGASGPLCSATGFTFNNAIYDYVSLTPWTWGGATTFEAYAMYTSFNAWGRIYDFENCAAGCDNVLLHLYASSSTCWSEGKTYHLMTFFGAFLTAYLDFLQGQE